MTTKVFRFSLLRRWLVLLVGLAVIGLLIKALGLVVAPSPFKESLLGGVVAILSIMLLLLVLLIAYAIWVIWLYSIQFSETELRVGRYVNPFTRHFQCLYTDIKQIRRGAYRLWIEIVPHNGKSFIILTKVKGGSDALIDEMEKHIQAEKFQPYLRKEMKRFSRADWAQLGFPIFIGLFLLLQLLPKMVLPYVAWQTEWGAGFLPSSYVNNYWIDNDGTAWISVMDIGDTAQIIRINGKEQKSWVLENDEEVMYANAIVADSSEQPWLIQRKKVLHWMNSSWQISPLGEYTILPASSVVDGNMYWALATKDDQFPQFLMALNLDSGLTSFIHLPDQMIQNSFFISDIKLAPDGAIVISLVNRGNSDVYFYSYKDDQWINSYSLNAEWILPEWAQLSPNLASPFLRYMEFTIDHSGQIWILMELNGQPVIGHISPTSNDWEWSYIEPDCGECSASYNGMIVDGQGRVWLEGEYGKRSQDVFFVNSVQPFGLDIFIPHWGEMAEHVTRYTNGNSNYQVGIDNTGLKYTSDGRVWVAGYRLVWINGADPVLPNKMPNWFAKITDPLVLMVVYIVGIVLVAILYLGVWVFGLIQKRNKPARQNNS